MFTPARPVKRKLIWSTPRAAPFKRSRATRYNAQTKRYASSKLRSTGSLTSQVKSLQRAVKALAPEMKYIETSLSNTNVTNAGIVTHITAIAQGDDTNMRTGNAVCIKSIALRFRIDIGSFTSGNEGTRLAIVRDTQQVADTAPTIATMFTTTVNVVTALPLVANLQRFKVLWLSPYISHHRMTLGTITNLYECNLSPNVKVDFNGTAATDQQKNGIYFVLMTNDAANTMDIDGVVRLGFTDA